eukprot:5071807-Ditylum_brightwellii.AAC.1
MPAIIEINCTLTGTVKAIDKGWTCPNCYQMQKKIGDKAKHKWAFGREMTKLAKSLPKETYKLKKLKRLYCYLQALNPSACEAVAANLGEAPSKHWIAKLNARDK